MDHSWVAEVLDFSLVVWLRNMDEVISFYFVLSRHAYFISECSQHLVFLEAELHRLMREQLAKLGVLE